VLAVHNGEPWLDEAVASILGQSFRDFEFIIVDDGSTDGTPAALARWAARDGRIALVRQEKSGHEIAVARGLAMASGELVARMDTDDVALPRRFERQAAFLDRHPDIALVGGAIEFIDASGATMGFHRPPTGPTTIRATLPRANCIAHPAVMARHQALLAAGGYRLPYRASEDYDLWHRLSEGARLANLAEMVLRHRLHARSVSYEKAEQQAFTRLAARHTAALRRQGLPDPTAGAAGSTARRSTASASATPP
jgi:glycosyltransferase involved in cell wall biosynthesis